MASSFGQHSQDNGKNLEENKMLAFTQQQTNRIASILYYYSLRKNPTPIEVPGIVNHFINVFKHTIPEFDDQRFATLATGGQP
jgi:hypothetical protein